jgi:thiamine pyrophosphate-dependent acetolactate synthase large subunit-like protein
MVLAELETVARLRLPVTIAVFNDSALSLIKIKQRASGHGGPAAVNYNQTDYAAIAAGCGIPSVRVTCPEQLTAQARASLDVAGPVLLDVLVDASGYPHVFDAIRGGDG